MNKHLRHWLLLLVMLMVQACDTSDPSSLPNRPFMGPVSSGTTILHTLPAADTTTSYPLQIDALRARAYPGSDIVIESTLNPGVNYNRYYVSYMSDGLKIYALMTVPNGPKPPTGWPAIIFNHGYIPPNIYRTT